MILLALFTASLMAGLKEDLAVDNREEKTIDLAIEPMVTLSDECKKITYDPRQRYKLEELEQYYNSADTVNEKITAINQQFYPLLSELENKYQNTDYMEYIKSRFISLFDFYPSEESNFCTPIEDIDDYKKQIKQKYNNKLAIKYLPAGAAVPVE